MSALPRIHQQPCLRSRLPSCLRSCLSTRLRFSLITATSLFLTACGSSDKNNAISETEGDVEFRVTLTTHWDSVRFPTQYPNSAHWSSPVGTVHNEQVVFWREGDQPASGGIESMAETGATDGLHSEIQSAQSSGFSQGLIKLNSISDGTGSSSIVFATTDAFPLFTLVSMIAPSPDWFIGVDSIDLKDGDNWIDEVEIPLPLYDAGTDAGLSFTSDNIDTSDQSLPIELLTSDRADSDFSSGIHYDTAEYVATLRIERMNR